VTEVGINATERPEDVLRRYARILVKVDAIHQALPYYDECGHTPEQHDEAGVPGVTTVKGYLACRDSYVFDICKRCCTDAASVQTEECATVHEHGPRLPVCDTAAALDEVPENEAAGLMNDETEVVTARMDEADRSCKGGEGCNLKSAAVPVPGCVARMRRKPVEVDMICWDGSAQAIRLLRDMGAAPELCGDGSVNIRASDGDESNLDLGGWAMIVPGGIEPVAAGEVSAYEPAGPRYDGESVPVLRQALWDIYAATGADTDGQRKCPAPGVLTPDIHMRALEEVCTLRRDYTAALDEIPGPDQVAVGREDLRGYLDFTNAWLTDVIMRDAGDLFSRLSAAAGEVA
jgi:hypothetical protein